MILEQTGSECLGADPLLHTDESVNMYHLVHFNIHRFVI